MPKLKKFKEKVKNNNRKNIIISAIIIVGLLSIFVIYKSYAVYKVEKKYDVIKAKIGMFGLPTCTISGNPTNWTTSATLKIEIVDQGKIQIDPNGYSWDGTNFSENTTKNVTKNGTYVGYVKDVKGNVVSCSVDVTKVDNVTPVITMNSGVYDKNDASKIASATYGDSKGSLSCVNTSRSNANVTTINNISTYGPNVITCTAKSNAGLSVSKTATITIQHILTYGDGIAVTNSGYASGSSVVLPRGGVQFGPYSSFNAGCYHIVYEGNNLNANPLASNDDRDGHSLYRAYTHGDYTSSGNPISYEIKNLSATSYRVDYNIYFSNNSNSVELSLYNLTPSTTITVDRIWVNYLGATCP